MTCLHDQLMWERQATQKRCFAEMPVVCYCNRELMGDRAFVSMPTRYSIANGCATCA